MLKNRFRLVGFILCLGVALGSFAITSAQDASPTAAPTMDMRGMDMGGSDAGGSDAVDTGEVTIHFAGRVGDKNFACGITYDGLGSDNSSVQVSDFRFYISNIRLIDADQNEVPLALEQDGLWQYENVALLDFEDGTGPCGDGGNPELRSTVVGVVPPGTYSGIEFELGVPFELNHLDISTANSPLNLDAMWWGWQVGFKFLRIDLTANDNPYFIHLGSTGCESANQTTAPEKPCSNSNRVEVRLDGFDPARNFVVADLATLVKSISLQTSSPRPPGCMSGPDDTDCSALFPNLGLILQSGAMQDGNPQQFFHIG